MCASDPPTIKDGATGVVEAVRYELTATLELIAVDKREYEALKRLEQLHGEWKAALENLRVPGVWDSGPLALRDKASAALEAWKP